MQFNSSWSSNKYTRDKKVLKSNTRLEGQKLKKNKINQKEKMSRNEQNTNKLN